MLPHGKYVRINRLNPRAIAYCDITGLPCMHDDLRKQMQYAGSGLIDTKFLVNKRFLDKPNPQLLSPLIQTDPKPIINPRPEMWAAEED